VVLDYYTAAVCRRGHIASSAAELTPPGPRCEECGARIITACPQCSAALRGPVQRFGYTFTYVPPDFCVECGTPFPWASRDAIVYHIENQLEEQDDLTEGDRRSLLGQLRALAGEDAADQPKQVSALQLLRRLAPKAWDAALPAIQALLTAEMRIKLGLPPI
jgi:hypothetical protein